MSDEYASSGYKGSLANETVGDQIPSQRKEKDKGKTKQGAEEEVQNYPDEGDTTSSGGFGSSTNIYSPRAQRGNVDPFQAGRFHTPDVDSTDGIKEVIRNEQSSVKNGGLFNESGTLGPIYSDGLAGSEEDIQDAIEGGLSRYELDIEFGVPVDRRDAKNDVVEI